MTDKIPDGFLPKPEALEKYQKPERTFQRRLAKALQVQNVEFLTHLILATSDGSIRKGTNVEHREVERLKGKGLYPVWHIEEKWFASEYDRKSSSNAAPRSEPVFSSSVPTRDRTSIDRNSLVTEIESLNRELNREREHNSLITKQLSIKDDQIEAANKIVLESNSREKEYSSLLKELAGRIPSLDSGSRMPSQNKLATTTTTASQTPAHEPIDADVVVAKQEARKKPTTKKRTKNATKPAAQRRSVPAKRPAVKKNSSVAKKKLQKTPKWYEAPTVRRIFRR